MTPTIIPTLFSTVVSPAELQSHSAEPIAMTTPELPLGPDLTAETPVGIPEPDDSRPHPDHWGINE
jgi:hypothetical protein